MYCVRGRFPSRRAALVLSTGLAAILALAIVSAPEASAQAFFGVDTQQKTKTKKPRTAKKPATPATTPDAAKQTAERAPEGPLVLTVSLKAQRVQVFDGNGLVATAPISSGRVGNATPTGVFTILEKQKIHYSNLYDSAPMPNMNRITWSGVALHAGVLPGYPASHGCIRLPHSFSSKLFGMTKVGHRVIVSRDPVAPHAIEHAKLFKGVAPMPPPSETSALAPAPSSKMADASDDHTQKDIAPQGSPVSAVLGVTSAAAEPVPAPAAQPATYREKWLAEMARLATAVTDADVEKRKAIDALALATTNTEDAKEDLKIAQSSAAEAETEKKKAERALAAADADLKSFIRRMTGTQTLTEETALKAGETEDTLENAITDRTKALETATADAAKAAALAKETEAAFAGVETARKDAAAAVTKADAALAAAIEADAAAKRREAKRKSPISVFVSLKTKKLYIRQGHEPILETAVAIANPERPIGTHVFTALTPAAPGDETYKWTVVSVPTHPQPAKAENGNKKTARDTAPPPPAVTHAPQTAADALDRITVPDDVRELVADSMKPGSSLMISDYGLSNETGKFTDFIVSLH